MKPLNFLRYRPVAGTLAVIIIWGIFALWQSFEADRRLPAAAIDNQDRLHIAVAMSFQPEPFHMTRLQDLGRLIMVEDQVAYLMDVPTSQARWLARRYWVKTIEPWEGI